MNLKLKLKLQEKIEEWMDENYEDEEIWPIIYLSDNTKTLMTEASVSVFDAIVDTNKFIEESR